MASSKNYTEVLIGGKVFTLSGFESEDYLQKVSTYLNHKLDECSNSEGYRKQSAETRSILLALNIADDYFKAKTQVEKLEREIEQKEKRKRLPIIAVTARAMFGDKERILENKLDDYIAKPYNLNDVVETLNKYIDD